MDENYMDELMGMREYDELLDVTNPEHPDIYARAGKRIDE